MIEEARGLASRRGSGKYVQPKQGKRGELYNLDSDIGEQDDVAGEREAIARKLDELLRRLEGAAGGVRNFDD